MRQLQDDHFCVQFPTELDPIMLYNTHSCMNTFLYIDIMMQTNCLRPVKILILKFLWNIIINKFLNGMEIKYIHCWNLLWNLGFPKWIHCSQRWSLIVIFLTQLSASHQTCVVIPAYCQLHTQFLIWTLLPHSAFPSARASKVSRP